MLLQLSGMEGSCLCESRENSQYMNLCMFISVCALEIGDMTVSMQVL